MTRRKRAPPEVDPEVLRQDLDKAGLGEVDLEVALVLGGTQDYPGG